MPLQQKLFGSILLLVCCLTAHAASDPLNFSIEELLDVVVTSVAKKTQTLAETAAAVHIITNEDIRHSGATSIPEVLRLAPGVQVAALGNNKWAISIRGQAGRYSNKLLVLVDGRSVYTPRFSGTIWESLDIPLETIERIEVMRGPGASVWGSNAVNGVINIITRSPFDSLGGEVTVSSGSELEKYNYARYGWRLSEDLAVSAYAKAHHYNGSGRTNGTEGLDDWINKSAGFKVEKLLPTGSIQVQGSLYNSDAGDELAVFSVPPAVMQADTQQTIKGSHLMARWQEQNDKGEHKSLQLYTDHYDYTHIALLEKLRNVGGEYQQEFRIGRHDINAGLYYLNTQDRIDNTSVISVSTRDQKNETYSFFIEDDFALQPGRWRLTLGTRLEHTGYTGFNLQPNARLLWTPAATDSIWVAISKAVRIPSRSERGMITNVGIDYSGPLPAVFQLVADKMQNETLKGLDFGWRHQFSSNLNVDLNLFHYRYDNMRGSSITDTSYQPPGYLLLTILANNANDIVSTGGELAVDWQPLTRWKLQASYSWLDMTAHLGNIPGQLADDGVGTSPQGQFSIRSTLELNHKVHVDAWLRHVGTIPLYQIPAYTTLDVRVAWEPIKNLNLSIVGQNLLDSQHPEFSSLILVAPLGEIERSVYASLNFTF